MKTNNQGAPEPSHSRFLDGKTRTTVTKQDTLNFCWRQTTGLWKISNVLLHKTVSVFFFSCSAFWSSGRSGLGWWPIQTSRNVKRSSLWSLPCRFSPSDPKTDLEIFRFREIVDLISLIFRQMRIYLMQCPTFAKSRWGSTNLFLQRWRRAVHTSSQIMERRSKKR